MVQGGSKRKGCAVADKEAAEKSWICHKSVLDVKLTDPDLPDPPVGQYLAEVPMCMRGGAGDAIAQAHDSPTIRLVQSLTRVLSRGCAEKACRALLWLAVGGVFGKLPQEGLMLFREDLGDNWYLLSLALGEESGGDRRLQDWVAAALPFVLAQAIYRMLCDCFTEDRKIFSSNADKLVGKVTQVVHFELTGFQMTADTVRKERRRLLQRHIFKSPHTNQREYLRGQRRQEMLESQNTHIGDQPLRFGEEEAHPLEETQLHHVMESVTEARSQPRVLRKESGLQSNQALVPGSRGVPPELSVERYAHISEQGSEMLERQLEEFAVILGEVEEEEELSELQPELSAPSTPVSPGGQRGGGGGTLGQNTLTLPFGAEGTMGSRRPSIFEGRTHRDAPSDDEGSEGGMSASPKPKKSAATPVRRISVQSMATASMKFSQMRAQNLERKAKEEKARKQRQELLHRKICVDKLPSELCEREFSTTWVSPSQMSLMKAEDRNTLNKQSSEAHVLKMATRPLSMPALRPKASSGGAATPGSGEGAKDEAGSAAGGGSKVSRGGHSHGRANSTVGADVAVGNSALPRVQPAGNGLHGSSAPRVCSTKAETVSLEPPSRLSAKVVVRRLEDQAKASKQMSFALYMKEYDIFTDMLKRSVDEDRLRDEEDACLARTNSLLNGPPKRRLAPEDLRTKAGPRRQPT